MRALIARLQHADGVVELQRLAREQHQLGEDAQMEQHQHDGGELEELLELDVDLQDRQLHRRLQEELLVRDAGHRDHEIGHDGEEDEPARIGIVAGVVDSLEQAVGVNRRLRLRSNSTHIRHPEPPQIHAGADWGRP